MNKRFLILVAVLALVAMNAFGGVAFAKGTHSSTAVHNAVTAQAASTEGEEEGEEGNEEEESESEAENEQ